MTETRTAMRKLTFDDGLPIGTRATFKENGETWICLPKTKYVNLLTICDNLIGALNATRRDCISWINMWPSDAARVAKVLEIVARADEKARTAAQEKVANNAL